MLGTELSTLCIISLNPQINYKWQLLLFLFCTWNVWGSKKLSNLLKPTQHKWLSQNAKPGNAQWALFIPWSVQNPGTWCQSHTLSQNSLPMVLKLCHASESSGGLFKTDHWPPSPEVLIQEVWGQSQEFAFLTSSRGMLMLLVQEPDIDKCYTALTLRHSPALLS